MNDKKHSLKKILAAFLLILPLAGCTQAPKEVNGQPVHEVPFSQPLVLTPETGQDFYFYIKKNEGRDMVLLINMIIPSEEMQTLEQVLQKIELEKKWLIHHGSKPGKEALLFDVKAEYHTENAVIPVSLEGYPSDPDNADKADWQRFGIYAYSSHTRELDNGKSVRVRSTQLAVFNPYEMSAGKGGIYKVSVKPVSGVRYPTQFDLEFSVWPYYYGK